MFQQGTPGAAASWAGLDEGTAAAVQRVWLAVAEASGLLLHELPTQNVLL